MPSSSKGTDGIAGAFAVLGLTSNANADEIRDAFRSRLLAVHPDIAGDAGGEPTLALLSAYRIALEHCAGDSFVDPSAVDAGNGSSSPSKAAPPDAHRATPPDTVVKTLHRHPPVWLIDHDTIAMACPHEEAFARTLEVGHSLGSITYLDRQGELLEVLLRTKLGDTVSLVISFQGRSEWVEAFLTTEALDRAQHPLPTTAEITELYAHQLAARWQ
jgi:hypothetical protein